MSSLFIFDGDCSFCSTSARFLEKITRHRVPIKPYQFLNLEQVGVPRQDAEAAVQFLIAGERYQGARAIAEALIASKTTWVLAGWFIKTPVILSFAELVYLLVAKNRHRLPGGTPACKLER
ncbi:DUF393 domain-containing protein [Aquiluna sp. KACHI24]|uniref:thiol-disulfide oxidoreductase DCC family protein n=1 Tax=Aquiluna sp. KACHI24 TaxID=2968831 RepID=UPI002206CD62|nr:DUF393 domain-containing protein [Aquiluna sp. KACHI24]BDQ00728.1 hypothetical protein AKACHI_10640 [Aquiluna sp. KACHI24]